METASNFSTNNTANSWYMESGSYLRMKNLQLGYTIPASLLARYGIQRLKVYAQAVNLFTITKYPGNDPETSDDAYSVAGGYFDVSKRPELGTDFAAWTNKVEPPFRED